jgi:hypothetical protein
VGARAGRAEGLNQVAVWLEPCSAMRGDAGSRAGQGLTGQEADGVPSLTPMVPSLTR